MFNLSRWWSAVLLLFLTTAVQLDAQPAEQRHLSRSVEKAGFVPGSSVLFPSPSSLFNGLISSTNGVYPEQSGYFRFTVYPNGAFVGNMLISTRRVSLNGYFSPNGTATTYIYAIYNDGCCYSYYYLAWIVDLAIIPGSDEIQGAVTWLGPGPWMSEILGYRSGPWNSRNPSPLAGKYTIRFPGSTDPTVAPSGDGYASMTVNSLGTTSVNGALADGTRFSRSVNLSTNGFAPLWVSTDSGLGVMIGWLVFNPAPPRGIIGDLVWIKPAQFNATYYPSGFEGIVAATGSPYLRPSATNAALNWTSGIFRISGGNLSAPHANSVALSPAGKLTSNGGTISNLTFSLNPNTGIFSGRFRDPETARTRYYYGALIQNEGIGGGYFLGANQGGLVQLEAAP